MPFATLKQSTAWICLALAAALATAGCAGPKRSLPKAGVSPKVAEAIAQIDAQRRQIESMARRSEAAPAEARPGEARPREVAPGDSRSGPSPAMQVGFSQPARGNSSPRGAWPIRPFLANAPQPQGDRSQAVEAKPLLRQPAFNEARANAPAAGAVLPASYQTAGSAPNRDAGPSSQSNAGAYTNPSAAPPVIPEPLPDTPAFASEGSAPETEPQPWEDPAQPFRDIDLSAALGVASGQNPQIQFALAKIQQSYAEYNAARVLWLPTLRLGASYNRHDGRYQNSAGQAIDINRSSLQSGFGVGAVGVGTQPFPGALAYFRLSDAVFKPRIAERQASASEFAASATTNETLLDTALAYLELLRAGHQQAIAMETRDNIRDLAQLTQSFADRGQGPQADADRMQTELAVRENEVQRASEAIETSSAALAMQLSVDPSIRLLPREQTVVPIELVAWKVPARELVAQGLAGRPELAEAQSLVAAATVELRRERYASLLPSVLLGFSFAGFGGGLGTAGLANNFGNRIDYDAIAYWEVRNFGFGEQAARDSARARTQQAQWRQMRMLDKVATDVTSAHAQVRARAVQIETAQKGVEKALDSYRRNMQRIRHGEGLPIEVLQSIQALDQSRREYLRTVIDYDVAQFRLHWALGWP